MYIRFTHVDFSKTDNRVEVYVEPVSNTSWREDVGDFYRPTGLLHYLYAFAPENAATEVLVRSSRKKLFRLTPPPMQRPKWTELADLRPSAKRAENFALLLRAARPHLGAPLVWGHNRGHGDLGFDPFTFIFHVYKRSLRLPVTEARQIIQAGCTVDFNTQPIMPGDLLVFAHGRHVGIYVGADQLLCAGGGAGRVGYRNLLRGKYRLRDLTMVRRLL